MRQIHYTDNKECFVFKSAIGSKVNYRKYLVKTERERLLKAYKEDLDNSTSASSHIYAYHLYLFKCFYVALFAELGIEILI